MTVAGMYPDKKGVARWKTIMDGRIMNAMNSWADHHPVIYAEAAFIGLPVALLSAVCGITYLFSIPLLYLLG